MNPYPDDRESTPTTGTPQEGPGRLIVLEGERIGRYVALERDVTVIGRAEDCNLRLSNPHLSRHHAEVLRRGDDLFVRDLGSSNGTRVNGRPVESEPMRIQLGDKIHLGRNLLLQLAFHDPIEEQLLQRQRLETLGRLSAGVAHDFNNMLGAITSNLNFLQSLPSDVELGDVDVKESLSDVLDAAHRAAELSRRLVTYARGDVENAETVPLGQVVETVARLVRRTFGRHIDVVIELDGELWVEADPLDLHQVLMNLCLNARDAMPGGGQLTLEARPEAASDLGAAVIAKVTDTGHGMPERTLRRIFEPFFSTKGKRGFGVGLSTCQDIVQRLGGTIDVESEVGKGTTFSIRLPATTRRRRMISTVQPTNSLTGAGLTVLVIDDEDVVRRGLTRVLTQAGHEVTLAASADEGLAAYTRAERPDLVLLDVEMPKVSGDAALALLLDIDPDARVVMISGHRDPEREEALRSSGARGFLRKPWQADELLRVLNDVRWDVEDSSDASNPDSDRRTKF